MKRLSQGNLDKMLNKHEMWLKDSPNGEKANLRGANLTGLDLSNRNLSFLDLSSTCLFGCNLTETNLSKTRLAKTIIYSPQYKGIILAGADMHEAIIRPSLQYRGRPFTITIFSNWAQIGCKTMTIESWLGPQGLDHIKEYKLKKHEIVMYERILKLWGGVKDDDEI